MDIDATRKREALPDTCWRCGKVGHWSKDCPQRYDVRLMDTDELQTLLEDRLAALDVVEAEKDDPTSEMSEDFVNRSG
jgi:hypothetical protein